jgi:extracellular factor (EF) 3-hydroxypalmitic acid methyl ester biosynthesis protein
MSLFTLLTPESRERLERLAERVVVPARSRVIRRGDAGGDIFRVERGSVEVVDSRSRPEVILDVLGPGAVVGELSFLAGEPRSADVRAFEETILSRWPEAILRAALDADAALARDFFRALALMLAARLGKGVRSAHMATRAPGASIGGLSARPGHELAELFKAELLALEAPLRREDRATGVRLMGEAWDRFMEAARQTFASLSPSEAEAAGEVLGKELTPWLVRAHTAELTIARPGGRAGHPALLRHIERGMPQGSDPVGVALDAALLSSSTALGQRERQRATLSAVGTLLPEDRPARVTVLHCGSGSIPSAIGLMMQSGGELNCVDGDRDVLEKLDHATIARSAALSLRLLHEDVTRTILGRTNLHLSPQDLVVVSGVLEYVPDLALTSLTRVALGMLAPGGTVILDLLRPSSDRFFFDHVLGWRTVRRTKEAAAALLTGLGLCDLMAAPCKGAAIVLTGRSAA